MDENKIIEFPKIKELKSEIERLKTELSMLILAKDELVFVECKNIEMEYILALGNLEYKAYELNCQVLRLKRKIELIQTKTNRQEKIVVKDIEKTLDSEFEEFKTKLEEQIGKMNDALERSKGEALSDEDVKELKSLYRSIVKQLHPDLHENMSEEQMRLFYNAVSSYEACDLNALSLINSLISDSSLLKETDTSLASLTKEKSRLNEMIKKVNADIEKIKESYPYIMKEMVNNKESIRERKFELQEIIDEMQDYIEKYKAKTEEMLR